MYLYRVPSFSEENVSDRTWDSVIALHITCTYVLNVLTLFMLNVVLIRGKTMRRLNIFGKQMVNLLKLEAIYVSVVLAKKPCTN